MKTSTLRWLVILAVCAALGGAIVSRAVAPFASPRDQVQRLLDVLPRMSGTLSTNGVSGGVVQLPAGVIDLGDKPLYIWPTCTLRGAGINATLLKYSGKGFAIRFATNATNGFCSDPSIEDLAIRSDGDGVGIDANTTGLYAPRVRNLLIDCAGKAISLAMADPKNGVTRAMIENVYVAGWGSVALETSLGICTTVNGFTAMNNSRKPDPNSPIVKWDGSGLFANVHLEDQNNQTLLVASNTIEMVNQYFEPHSYGIPQVILNNCVATAQRTYYADERSWWELHGSTLAVAATVGGDAGKVAQAYRCEDAGSSVISRGKVIVGSSH